MNGQPRRRGLLLTGVVVAVLALCTVAWVNGWADGWLPRQADATVPATNGTIDQRVVAIGRIEPITEVTISNRVAGRIKEVLVKEGDEVVAGQPLIRFQSDEHETQVRVARARVATAEADVRRARRALETARARWSEVKSGARPQEIATARAEVDLARQRWQQLEIERLRFRSLYEGSLVPRTEYDRAEAEAAVARIRIQTAEESLKLMMSGAKAETVATAQALVEEVDADMKRAESQVLHARTEVEHMQALMRNTVVESSLAGRVTRKLVEPGEVVDVGVPLLVLGDTRRIIVRAEVDETDIGSLAIGQPATITADAYPGRVFQGKVYEIGQMVGKRKLRPDDPARIQDMKVLETKIEVIENAADLKLGMTTDVKIVVAYKERALVIPRRVVAPGATEATVRVEGVNGPEARVIRLGMRDSERVEVIGGLRAGERIVVTGRTP